jgi:preprotein translocase subunit YajC
MTAFDTQISGILSVDGVFDGFFPWLAWAAAAGGSGAETGGFLQMLPLMGIIFFVMYLMVIRPQRQEIRKHEEMISALSKHDEVRTAGGIIGKVALVDRDQGHVVIVIDESKGVRMKVALTSVSTVSSASENKETPSSIQEEETTK